MTRIHLPPRFLLLTAKRLQYYEDEAAYHSKATPKGTFAVTKDTVVELDGERLVLRTDGERLVFKSEDPSVSTEDWHDELQVSRVGLDCSPTCGGVFLETQYTQLTWTDTPSPTRPGAGLVHIATT